MDFTDVFSDFRDRFRDVVNNQEVINDFDPDSFNPELENPPVNEPDSVPVFDPEDTPPETPPPEDSPEINTELVVSKLNPIPVFTIADAEGAPLVATGDDGNRVAGVFISQEDANQFVTRLETENPELASQVNVIPVSLAEIYQLNEENSLNFAYVPEEEAVDSATVIGDANQEPYEGGVPLFAAKGGEDDGFLTIERDGEQVIPFFFDLEQLEELVARFEEERPDLAANTTIEVVPLEGVIETLATSDDELLERLVLVPTEESIQFLQSVDGGGDSTGNTGDLDDGRQDVYRFFDEETGVHFYTSSEVEKDNIVENLPNYNLEGVAYQVEDPLTGMNGANVVHRFRNQDTGIHIYTINEVERNFIAENLTNYEYEGEVFAAYTSQIEGTIPVHRFYNSQLDAHFYTPSEAEREIVENDLPNYNYEGIAYYAYPVEV